ncbi:L-threonylcarbamoyladenylate synthase [Cohnella yongneupensis]|uniref:Threonylcarbamoyl-AMP synthase n=1 Tax=Cohnella yongneupensis TaxID=425006 RepID=A0ABW0R1U2_9BACL
MMTKYWSSDPAQAGLKEAAAALADGGIVAFPTETVYGLGGDAGNTEAVTRIFAAKGRPSDNPLIVHLAEAADVGRLATQVTEIERRLMEAFWPGPLTLVLPVREGVVSPLVTAGLDTVAVRVPAHETARRLIAESGCPLAAPSANRSGRPSPTQASHVREDLDGRIDGILDGGPTGVGLESTVVRVIDDRIHILRPGGVTCEMLQQAVGGRASVQGEESRQTEASLEQAPRSPGVKYAHYAPKGELLLVTGEQEAMIAAVQSKVDEARALGSRVGVLACTEHAGRYEADAVLDCGPRSSPEVAAQALYAHLRECDARELDFIVAEGYEERGIGTALMNRLRKAAGGRVLNV